MRLHTTAHTTHYCSEGKRLLVARIRIEMFNMLTFILHTKNQYDPNVFLSTVNSKNVSVKHTLRSFDILFGFIVIMAIFIVKWKPFIFDENTCRKNRKPVRSDHD